MDSIKHLLVVAFLLTVGAGAAAQDVAAPNIAGTSVLGETVNLEAFEGDKNVVVVFYRMHT